MSYHLPTLRASREDMMAAASSGPAPPPETSSNMKAGLTGNIVGQDVEAAKGNP